MHRAAIRLTPADRTGCVSTARSGTHAARLAQGLTEELGEASAEIDEAIALVDTGRLYAEVIQVVATAVAWAEEMVAERNRREGQ